MGDTPMRHRSCFWLVIFTVLVCAIFVCGTMLFTRTQESQGERESHSFTISEQKDEPLGIDLYGDPLPPGAVARMGTIRFRHQCIGKCVYSPDGKLLAVNDCKTIRLWEARTGKEIHALTAHQHSIGALAFSPDGTILASGDLSANIRIWDTATGKELRHWRLEALERGRQALFVSSLAFTSDGKTLASGGGGLAPVIMIPNYPRSAVLSDNTIHLWDIATGKEIGALTGHEAKIRTLAFGPSGKTLASVSLDRTVRLWDVSTAKEIRAIAGVEYSSAAAFSPDGKMLASGASVTRSESDKLINLWDLTTGKVVHTLTGHQETIDCLAFSADCRILASGSRDKTIRLWDLAAR